jgi:hypothetical protein
MQVKRGFSSVGQGHGCGSLWRGSISLFAALAVFVALLNGQCAAAQATSALTASAVAIDAKALPAALPGDQLPGHDGHCAHCLCHAADRIATGAASVPIQFCGTAFSISEDRSARSFAGLPLFKPPRI